MEKYFAENTLTNDEIRDGMRKAARDAYLKTVPVFVTSGAKNVGTVPLMEALVVYVSPPSQRRVQYLDSSGEKQFLTAPQSDDGPLAAYVFKTTNDRFVGTLNYFRIFSGSMHSDGRYFNPVRNVEERFNSMLVMRGKEQMPVPLLHAGDIGVVAKLNDTKTGDTFSTRANPIRIVKPDFPDPLYAVAVSPKTQADSAKMGTILTSLSQSDPTLRWRQDPDVKQTIVEGMGEAHVNLAISRALNSVLAWIPLFPKCRIRKPLPKRVRISTAIRSKAVGQVSLAKSIYASNPIPVAVSSIKLKL